MQAYRKMREKLRVREQNTINALKGMKVNAGEKRKKRKIIG